MVDVIKEVDDAVYESEKRGEPTGWAVYVPRDWLGEIVDLISERSHMEVYQEGTQIAGRDIIPDEHVSKPIALPKSVTDVPLSRGCIENAPRQLVKQLVATSAQIKSADDPLRAVEGQQASVRIPFDVCNEHRRINHAKRKRLGLPLQKTDYDKEPDSLERAKIAYRVMSSYETQHTPANDLLLEELVDGVLENINSVHRSGVYQTRERKFTFPYACMDFTHREKIRIGTDYKHFGGVFLTPIDGQAKRLEIQAAPSSI